MAREKVATPLLLLPSKAKLLIISVNEQTRQRCYSLATIPWRNALFIIYQNQSTGHFPPPSIPFFRLCSFQGRDGVIDITIPTVSNYWNLIFREQGRKFSNLLFIVTRDDQLAVSKKIVDTEKKLYKIKHTLNREDIKENFPTRQRISGLTNRFTVKYRSN